MSDRVASIHADIGLDGSGFKKGSDTIMGSISGLISGLGGIPSPLAAVASGFIAVAKLMAEAERQAVESNVVMAKQEAILKATGYSANTTAQELSDYAEELSKLTGIDDEVIADSQSMLLTFRNIGRDELPRATQAALDLSTTFGDLNSSSMQLGKALNDPIKGVTALTRVGVTFTDQQKEMIQNYVDLGDISSAQAVILAEIENQVGGTAKAMEDAGDGSNRLKVSIGNLMENIGQQAIPETRKFNNALSDLLDSLSENVAGNTEYQKALEKVALQAGLTAGQIYAIRRGYKAMPEDIQENIDKYIIMERRTAAIDAEMRDLGYTLDETTGQWGRNTEAIREDIEATNEANNQILDYASQFSSSMNMTAEEHDKATKKIILGYMEQKLAADGILTDDETRWLLEKGVEWGYYSATAIAEMQKAMSEADVMISKLDGKEINMKLNIQTATMLTASMISDQAMYAAMADVYGYASGGTVKGGLSLVGENGPELVNLPAGSQVSTASETRNMMDNSQLMGALESMAMAIQSMPGNIIRAQKSNVKLGIA